MENNDTFQGIPYTIKFTDPALPGKVGFTINPDSTDGPIYPTSTVPDQGATEIHTSLVLPGMGYIQYGKNINEDLVHLLENHASRTPPVKPTIGQEWYDWNTQTMKVWNGNIWDLSGSEVVAAVPEYNILVGWINDAISAPSIGVPNNITPGPNAVGIAPDVTFVGSPYVSRYNSAQTGMQIQVSNTPHAATPNILDQVINGATTTFHYTSLLPALTAFYWRIRYRDSQGIWSEWSTETAFTTSNAKVNVPTITFPTASSTSVGLAFTMIGAAFTVTNGSDTLSSSDWEIWTGPDGTGTKVFSRYGSSGTTVAIPAGVLTDGTLYYPRVRYIGTTLGPTAWSYNQTFTTIKATVNQPSIIAPPSGSVGVSLTPTFTGSAFGTSNGPDTFGTANWEIWINGFDTGTVVFSQSIAGSFSVQVPAGTLAPGIRYYARVRYTGVRLVASAWSPYHDFVTINPTLTKPTFYTGDNTTITFTPSVMVVMGNTMSVSNGADTFVQADWEYSSGPNGTGTLYYSVTTDASQVADGNRPISAFAMDSMPNPGTAYCRVRYRGKNLGFSPWSDPLTFHLNVVVNPPAGTVLGTQCVGFDKYNTVANGSGGSFSQLVQANSPDCGYIDPFVPDFDRIPDYIYANRGYSSASAYLKFKSDGSWVIETSGTASSTTPNMTGRYLSFTEPGSNYDIMFTDWELWNDDGMGIGNYGVKGIPDVWMTLGTDREIGCFEASHDLIGIGLTTKILVRERSTGATHTSYVRIDANGSCFAHGTILGTPNGDVEVQDLAVGDMVNSFSEPTMLDEREFGWMEWTVDSLDKIDTETQSTVVANSMFIRGESIKINGIHSTNNHIHFVYDGSKYRWKMAQDVLLSDFLVDVDKNHIEITDIELVNTKTRFYALDVEDLDTLQIKYGDTYLLGHNVSA